MIFFGNIPITYEQMFLAAAAAVFLAAALYETIYLIYVNSKTVPCKGRVTDVSYVNPYYKKPFRNSKWARLAYPYKNRPYISKNKIQIPFSKSEGDFVSVRCFISNPEKITAASPKRCLVLFCIFLICTAATFFI